jgi:quercetin dioxygenase-like cupin family protein
MSAGAQPAKIQYVYDMAALDAAAGSRSARVVPDRPAGPVVSGSRAHVAMTRRARGTGHGLRLAPAEQFKYVMRGSLTVDLDGQLLAVPRGHVLHVPVGMPHALCASEGEDVTLIEVSDARDDGTAVEWKPCAVPAAPQSPNITGQRPRYVYAIDELDDMPEGPSSAVITPRNFVSKKSSSIGASLKGEMLQVGLIRKARGSGAKLHTHPNEQFNLVLEGRLVGEIGGYPMEVPAGSLIHMPATVEHCTLASADGDVTFFVVKDTSHGMAGPPVDGIEDGPRYLPGFGPKK